jgi:hypothetical protein
MAAPVYVSPAAQRLLAAHKTSRTKPVQSHRYHVRVNRDHACQCTHDDVAGVESAKPNHNQMPAHRMPQAGVDPMREILAYLDKLEARVAAVFDGLGLDLPESVVPEGRGPFDSIIARLRWIDRAITITEYHASGLERAVPPRANAQRSQVYQPRGAEAEESPVSNMRNLTFGPEHLEANDGLLGGLTRVASGVARGVGAVARGAGAVARGAGRGERAAEEAEEGVPRKRGGLISQVAPVLAQYALAAHERKKQQQEEEDDQGQSTYADAPQTVLAQKAHGVGPSAPLSRAEARSMTSPRYAPVTPLEDRYQRGEERPRELIDTFPKGNPYRAGGMSASPDAPAPQNGRGREGTKLDATTGRAKYAFRQTYSGDHALSTGDLIRALSKKSG